MTKDTITIANRLFTTFMLLIAIIATQNMTQKNSDRVLTIRIQKPEKGIHNVHNSDSSTVENDPVVRKQ